MYDLCLLPAQASIALLYIRVWAHERLRKVAYVLLAIVLLDGLFAIIATLTACVPLNAFWDPFAKMQGAYCHPDAVWLTATYTHVAVDFLIYCLPMPIIFKLSFPFREKAILFCIFALAFL